MTALPFAPLSALLELPEVLARRNSDWFNKLPTHKVRWQRELNESQFAIVYSARTIFHPVTRFLTLA